jgi:hypothetical protein
MVNEIKDEIKAMVDELTDIDTLSFIYQMLKQEQE